MTAYIVAAARTVIAPKGGLHRDMPLHELATPALRFAWQALQHSKKDQTPVSPDLVILGNALAAGGNPARVAALAAFDASVPAMTVDTQCCSGMDAVAMAAHQIESGSAGAVLAGGIESHSQAPQRSRKTSSGFEPYSQAQFTPWPERDPNVLVAAQAFAQAHEITREQQEHYAIESHAKLLRHAKLKDTYTRELSPAVCQRMPAVLRGAGERNIAPSHRSINQSGTADNNPDAFAITAATVAPEADGAAALLIINQRLAKQFPIALEIVAHAQAGCDPISPALGGIVAAEKLLENVAPSTRKKIRVIEVMESFAAQAIHNCRWLTQRYGFDDHHINPHGGLLAIGHPIGASGAVLVGNLFVRLAMQPVGTYGMACIPAAGGLGSAILVKRVGP
jgi:acetyl-CoA C-acetyltransferase